MVRVTSIALVLMMPALALAQLRIPTGDADKQPAPEAPPVPAYGIEQPLFAPERMARDASPEHVKMMNSLSFASAVPVAVADAARIVADREAQRLVAAAWVSLLREYKALKGEPYPDKTPAAFVQKDVFEMLSRAKGGEGARVHEGYAFLRWVVDTYGAQYQVYVPHPELAPETDIDVVEPGREAIAQMVNAAFEKAQQGVLQQGALMEAIQQQQGGAR